MPGRVVRPFCTLLATPALVADHRHQELDWAQVPVGRAQAGLAWGLVPVPDRALALASVSAQAQVQAQVPVPVPVPGLALALESVSVSVRAQAQAPVQGRALA
jgi:hypothetical protein